MQRWILDHCHISLEHTSSPKLLLYCIRETVHTDSELSVTQGFTENYYHIKTSQLICIVYQLAGFFMVQVVTEGYFFGKD